MKIEEARAAFSANGGKPIHIRNASSGVRYTLESDVVECDADNDDPYVYAWLVRVKPHARRLYYWGRLSIFELDAAA